MSPPNPSSSTSWVDSLIRSFPIYSASGRFRGDSNFWRRSVRFPSPGVRSDGVVERGIERIDVRCRFSCFLRYLASSFGVPVRSPASARVVYGRRVAGGKDFMAASFAPVGPSWSIGGGASPLLLWVCWLSGWTLLLLRYRRRQQHEVCSWRRKGVLCDHFF